MPKLTPSALKEALARDLPGMLVPGAPTAAADRHASAEPAARRKGESAPANLLATEDAVVEPARIKEAAAYLRDSLGYELLTNLTAVDYLSEGVIEIVYHFAHVSGGTLTIKARVPREKPKLPSLCGDWPGANLQEREAYDLYGVVFTGHPNLRRIYMWEEFEGFPMRKDFPRQGDKYLGEVD